MKNFFFFFLLLLLLLLLQDVTVTVAALVLGMLVWSDCAPLAAELVIYTSQAFTVRSPPPTLQQL